MQELEKEGRTSLGDLMEKRIPGFGATVDKNGKRSWVIKLRFVYLVIDGVDVFQFMIDDESYFLRIQALLNYFDAEEIQGIEIMTNKTAYYRQKFAPLADPLGIAFVEVTTRSGHGPFLKKTIGTNLYRPIPFTMPKKFYSPRYNPQSMPDMKDIRSTIYWNPHITTNIGGIATVSFFTADTPGSYSLIIEGTDLDGSLGVERRKFTVMTSPPK